MVDCGCKKREMSKEVTVRKRDEMFGKGSINESEEVNTKKIEERISGGVKARGSV